MAAVVSSRNCHARLERCARCEDHRVVCWWDPCPGVWVGAMGRHAASLRERVVRLAYGLDAEEVGST